MTIVFILFLVGIFILFAIPGLPAGPTNLCAFPAREPGKAPAPPLCAAHPVVPGRHPSGRNSAVTEG